MINLIKKKENFIIVLVLLIFLTTNNFFYNFYYILKTNISDRMIYHYGYCQKNGFGFIKYINNKHKLNKNIKIYNSVEYPLSDWFFYKPNIGYYEKKIILLNYNNLSTNEKGFNKINLNGKYKGNFKILEKVENCYFLEKIND
tara:strand:+ start:311 stop:739 length:429 start_codon:yes stop_codon:yes gene_type:complete